MPREGARVPPAQAEPASQTLNANSEAYGWFTGCGRSVRGRPERRAEMHRRRPSSAPDRATSLRRRRSGRGNRTFESVGAERDALTARCWLGRLSWLLGDNRSAATDRPGHRGFGGFGRQPGAGYGVQLPLAERHADPDFEAGQQLARKAIEIAEQTGGNAALVHAYNNLGACLMWKGHLEGADYLLRSLDLALEHHLPDDFGRAYANLSGQGNRLFPFATAQSEAFLIERSSTRRGLSPTGSSTDGSAPAGANSSSSPADGPRRSP